MSLSRYGGPTGSSIEGNVPDAAADDVTYGRKNNAWNPVLPIVGGTLSGPLTLAGAPTSANMATTKQYTDDAVATRAASGHNHAGVYDPAGTGASEAAAAVTAHEAASNPHPTYLTQAEGDAAYAALSHTHSNVTDGDKGDVTVSSGTWTIDPGAVTFAKFQDIATSKLLGRMTASTGDVEELSLGNGLTNDGTTIQVSALAQNSQSTAYTLVLSDAQKHLLHPSSDTTARTFTIPANSSVAYPVGTAITFVNQASAGVLTIAITTDTMRLAGAGTTGSRTLAANGIATALKITSTEWIISGTGLT
jgi:hypothetical protein